MKGGSVLLVSLILAASMLAQPHVASGPSAPPEIAGPPEPITGTVVINEDWTVTNYVRFRNAFIYLTGNLTVNNGGHLEMVNTTLAMNLKYNGQYRISVSGTFTMADIDGNLATAQDASIIMANNSMHRYTIEAQGMSSLSFSNSIIRDCGYDGLNQGLAVSTAFATLDGMQFHDNHYALSIKSNGVNVLNSQFSGNHYGIHSQYSNPTLKNLTVSGSASRGISLLNSNPLMENCTLLDNDIGIYFQNSGPDIHSCLVNGSRTAGIQAWYSSPLLADCELSNALDIALMQDSYPRLLNTTFNESRASIATGLYLSVGQRMTVAVVNSTGAALPGILVSVLDSEGNPSSSGITDGEGIAGGLAFRERFLTGDGLIEMELHRVMAFSLQDWDIVHGENITQIQKGQECQVVTGMNPPGVEIWPPDMVISNNRQYSNATIISYGDVNVEGGGLELIDSSLMFFSQQTRTMSCAGGYLNITDSSISSMGSARLLEPSRVKITADSSSPVRATGSSTRWTTEFSLSNSLSEISDLTVGHASVYGLRVMHGSPTIGPLSIDWSPVGLNLHEDSSAVSGITVSRAKDYAIYASQSAASLDGLFVADSGRGLYSYYGMLELSNVTMTGCEIGILQMNTIMDASRLNISTSGFAGFYSIDSKVTLSDSAITESGTAIYARTSTFLGESLSLKDNLEGLRSFSCAPVLLNSSLENDSDVVVDRGSSAALVNCTLDISTAWIQPSGHIDLGQWFHVRVLDQTLSPVPGCNVSVLDTDWRVSSSGITDQDGHMRFAAFRQSRHHWNSTDEYHLHNVLAFREFNGTLQGSAVLSPGPGHTMEVSVSPSGMGWTEWTYSRLISENIEISDTSIIAHGSVLVDSDAKFTLSNVTYWFFGKPLAETVLEANPGNITAINSRFMPLSARGPLQPSSAWITYRAWSSGLIANSTVSGINQITTYTSDLFFINSTVMEMRYAGIRTQSCSPTIQGSVFYRCGHGHWSGAGSPGISDTTFVECATNGFYSSGGSPVLTNVTSINNANGFKLENDSTAAVNDCRAMGNEYGIHMTVSSPSINDFQSYNNTLSGIYCDKSHPSMGHVQSFDNMHGLYARDSWPTVSNSSFDSNDYGVYSFDSAPFFEFCQFHGNGVAIQSTGKAKGIIETSFSSGRTEEYSNFIGGGVREHISITIPSRAMVTWAYMGISGSEIGGDAVIESKYWQFYPDIYENWLVWQELRDEAWDIFAYDLAMDSDGNGVPNYLETPALENDPALFRITKSPYDQMEPKIYGDTIVWADYRNGNADIYAYTFSNSTEWAVCINPSIQLKPAIHGDHIVWQDLRNGHYDIYMLNITAGEEVRLTDGPDDDMDPKIDGNHVVWHSYRGSPPDNDHSDIILFDLKKWELTNINDDKPIQYCPDVHHDTVVWHDDTNGNWEIYSHSISAGLTQRLTYDADNQQNFKPRIHGDRVVYYFRNRLTDLWSVRMFNITTGVQTVLERDVKGDSHPVIHGDRVAWVNRTGNKNDIYVLDFGFSGLPSDVSLDINMDGRPEFSRQGIFNGTEQVNSTSLAEALNRNLGRMSHDYSVINMSVSANGTGKVTLQSLMVEYTMSTFLVNCTISNSTGSGAICIQSSPVFINSTFLANAQDMLMGSAAAPLTLNTTFSDSKLQFQDMLSNLTVRNFLHVRVQNMTGYPLDAGVLVKDNGRPVYDTRTGESGRAMWMAVTDCIHNITGHRENITAVTVSRGSNVFLDNPRNVNMSSSRWEIFVTDTMGPEFNNPFPPPGCTVPQLRPEISVIITSHVGLDLSTVRLYVQGFAVFYENSPVPSGYNISYTHPMDFQNGTVILCGIYGRDIQGNEAEFSWEFKIDLRAQGFAMELHAGWNLISIPLEMHNMSLENVLWSIRGKYNSVKEYSRTDPAGPWLGHRPGVPAEFDRITAMNRHTGYWVHVTEPSTLKISGVRAESTSVNLYAGWNLVGYPSMTERSIAMALWGTGADRVEVYQSESPYIREAEFDYVLKPGEGFWVRVTADTLWVVDW